MSMFDYIALHPWWTLIFIVFGLDGLADVARALRKK